MQCMVRTRIAPSPTGFPHIGTAFQALFDYVYAKKHNGRFIIRLEDTDRSRLVDGAEQAIYDAFSWLGIVPDEGPISGGDYGPYRQSERLSIYKQHIEDLIAANHAYYCFCSAERLDEVRKEMQKSGQPPMYDKHCRNLDPLEAKTRAEHETHVVRMKVPANETITFIDEIRGEIVFDSNTVDDQVILKSDGFPTYHSAVVIDDHLMEITHVVRGEEWISSAPKHVLLYRYFGWEMPKLIHTPLLRNPDKSKLSKRHGHASVTWYQEKGYLKEAVINFLATRVWNHPDGQEVFGIEELIKHFDFSKMHIQGPIADLDKLNWLNGQWIRSKTDGDLMTDLKVYQPEGLSDELLRRVLPLIKERLVVLSNLAHLTHFFYEAPEVEAQMVLKEAKMTPQETAIYLGKAIDLSKKIQEWKAGALEEAFRKLQIDENIKPRPAFMTLRISLTGELATPPLFDVMEVLGQEETISRLQKVRLQLS